MFGKIFYNEPFRELRYMWKSQAKFVTVEVKI